MKSNPHEHLFLAGGQPPSIADLLAYSIGITGKRIDGAKTILPLLVWMSRMQQLPFHDEVHKALVTLGKCNG